MKPRRYRAATIALAVAALSLTILAGILSPLWGVHRAGGDVRPHGVARTTAAALRPNGP
jgi:hypothetical protein